ncbi:6-phosphogluconolactonase [Mesorhizobium xinjiangense]|uniref:6-phosphogluconolactonase n=1 Tax=Mesorhizobium xinjiangense TaxID=2678685 RepID=UPI0012EE243C|nr:6-phosphogluconolactonase [Mesorhizobium xinjiangense]
MPDGQATLQTFPSPERLAQALAERIAGQLDTAIAARGHATLAVSGGTTPERFFAALAAQPIDWSKVTVTLVDERFVPPASPRSNEALVRRILLQGKAAAARFVPLFTDAPTPDAAALVADTAIAALPLPFDALVLGMGSDGHTASFFPDAANLDTLLSPQNPARVMAVDTKAGGEPRLTLTLPTIAAARLVVLHIEGTAKKAVLDEALSPAGSDLPIRTVIDRAQFPVTIVWAPSHAA